MSSAPCGFATSVTSRSLWSAFPLPAAVPQPQLLPIFCRTATRRLRFDSRSRRGARETARLTFRDAASPPLVVSASGMVKQVVALSPPSLNLNDAFVPSSTLTITRLDGKRLEASAQNVPSPLVARLERLSPLVLRLQLKQIAPSLAGTHHEQMRLHLNVPGLSHLTVPVKWTVKGNYQMQPSSADFGLIPTQTPLQKIITISGRNASRLRVVSTPPGWKARLRTKSEHQAVLTLQGTLKGGLLNAFVVVATGDPRDPQIAVPLFAAASGTNAMDIPCASTR